MAIDTAVQIAEPPIDGNGGSGGSSFGGGQQNGGRQIPDRVYMTGIYIALGGIIMFFTALISAWVVRRGLGTDWQPLQLPRILGLNTGILLASSAALFHSRRLLNAHRDADHRRWWNISAFLGMFFVIGQLLAWRQTAASGVFLATNPASSFFYVFTAAHGIHILAGVIALIAISFVARARVKQEIATRVAATYWHAVTLIWLAIFALLLTNR
jgi:cytochrome c oxidase subunit III